MKTQIKSENVFMKVMEKDCEICESFNAWCKDQGINPEDADDLDVHIFSEDYSQNLWR